MAAVRAYIGLGSNLDNPVAQVQCALQRLGGLPKTRVTGYSGLYQSPPLGKNAQPDYINAVAALDTQLAPCALLDALVTIEEMHGRVRDPDLRWGPRTLDLDVLLYGNDVVREARLVVPHPGLAARAFVLYPLYAVAGDIDIPGLGALRDLLAQCPATGLIPLSGGGIQFSIGT